MDPDGSNRRFYARGLRNAVGVKWNGGRLYATNMGSDHLGNNKPDDTLFAVGDGTDYGWPYCYEYRKKIYPDKKFAAGMKRCPKVPLANTAFSAHSSPLGFEFFDSGTKDSNLRNSILVALHGSTDLKLRRGYRILRVRESGLPQDFINGFLQDGKINGRPCDVMKIGPDAFLFTDDYSGVVYYVYST
jgi:glucose/arabinose dehydrogenase